MFALIMAGGIGSRFWPLSRKECPKHLIEIINDRTMLENTVNRLSSFIENENTFVITNKTQEPIIVDKVSNLEKKNIIAEPDGRNTAAAIGYGAIKLAMIDPEAVMVVLPADHYIKNTSAFTDLIQQAAKYSNDNPESLVTIGIEPKHPETGYGYIQLGKEIDDDVYRVKNFAEKPNYETAVRFVQSGDFYWNSGIFVWKVKTILKAIETHLPLLHESLLEIKKAIEDKKEDEVIERIYKEIKPISIDYGVMEKAENVCVFKGDFGWSDVGSWYEMYRILEHDKLDNVCATNAYTHDTRGCYLYTKDKKKVVATIGLKNMAVIDTGDALLIAPLERSQEVKDLVEQIKNGGENQVL